MRAHPADVRLASRTALQRVGRPAPLLCSISDYGEADLWGFAAKSRPGAFTYCFNGPSLGAFPTPGSTASLGARHTRRRL